MTGNDQHPNGSNGSTHVSNVVHLRPRQWLESEDELVPIGGAKADSSADGAPAGRAPAASIAPDKPGHASTWLGAGEETVPIAREPAPQADTASDIADSARSPTPSWAASDFWGEDAANVHDALEAPVPAQLPDETPPPERRRVASPRRFLRAPALAGITVAAAAVLAAAIDSFGAAPAAHRQSAPTASLHPASRARSAP
ncbi:MAG: hypothetical protein M3071_20620, partial [Actinomycetota bacterium]|nr:hypothetical protein [Actinomycetota bacterium]